MDRDDREETRKPVNTRSRNDNESGYATMSDKAKHNSAITNANTGACASMPTGKTSEALDNATLLATRKLVNDLSALLNAEQAKGIDAAHYHSLLMDSLNGHYEQINQRDKKLQSLLESKAEALVAEQSETTAAATSASSCALQAIYDWRSEYTHAAELRDATTALVKDLKACGVDIKKEVATGISRGILTGKRLLIITVAVITMNTVSLLAVLTRLFNLL
jgi:hypothetical protein